MKRWLALLLMAAVPAVHAQTKALDELLRQVREGAAQTAKINQEREARFLKNRNEQQAMLQKAEADLAAARARSNAVRARFDANQKAIAELKAQLQSRAGDYTQVHAAVRQFAADFGAVAAESLVSAQYPDRLPFLNQIANNSELPGLADLEKLWFVLQQEMTEGGKVTAFKAEVVDDEGVRKEMDVTRVGVFAAFAGDRYLTLAPGSSHLNVLPRQPSRHLRGLAEDFVEPRDDGIAPILVDPSRGEQLNLNSERPSVLERIDQGGVVAYVIILIGVIGTAAAIFQLFYLLRVGAAVQRQLRDPDTPRDDNPLGRVLGVLRSESSQDPELLELHLSEAVLRETPRLERFQQLLRMVIAAGPLLGLLGTVGGMIITFQVITEIGAADPKAMAGGISQAMVATLLGLGIAIPLLFINSFLSSRSRVLVQLLDEQAAGMLAQRLERSRGGA